MIREDNVRVLHWLTIDGYAGVPTVGPSGKADIYYDNTAKYLKVMVDGGNPSVLPTLAHPAFNNVLGVPTFTVGTEAANAIVVTVQLKDINGVNIAYSAFLRVWISDAAGGVITGTGPNGTVAIANASGTIIETVTSKKVYTIATGATGEFQLSIGDSTTAGWYVNAGFGDGRIYSSPIVQFA